MGCQGTPLICPSCFKRAGVITLLSFFSINHAFFAILEKTAAKVSFHFLVMQNVVGCALSENCILRQRPVSTAVTVGGLWQEEKLSRGSCCPRDEEAVNISHRNHPSSPPFLRGSNGIGVENSGNACPRYRFMGHGFGKNNHWGVETSPCDDEQKSTLGEWGGSFTHVWPFNQE